MNDRILVTGANGFIGGALVPELVKLNYDVYALERYVSNRYSIPCNCDVKTIFADLTDYLAVDSLIRQIKPEIVIHLAALSPVSASYDRWQEYIEVNFNATINLAECLLRHDSNLKQFIYAGTSECYGNQKVFPIKETAIYKPNSPYSVSKVASVSYLRYMWEAYQFPVTLLFPFNSYGRAACQHFIVEKIIRQMLNNKTVCLGDPTPIRDLVYISDHVNGYISTVGCKDAIGESFNICTGKSVTIKELTDKLQDLTGFDGKIIWGTIPKRPLDIEKLIGDSSKAKKILGWHPLVDLDSGLCMTIEQLRRK